MALFLERYFLWFPKIMKRAGASGYGRGRPGRATRQMSVRGSAGRSCDSHVEPFAEFAAVLPYKRYQRLFLQRIK